MPKGMGFDGPPEPLPVVAGIQLIPVGLAPKTIFMVDEHEFASRKINERMK